MGDLPTRPYRAHDAAGVAELLNRITIHHGGHANRTPDDVHRFVSTVVRDVVADTRVVVAPSGDVVATGMTVCPPEGGFRADLYGGVHPRWRGRGIGRELLRWQLTRAADLRRAVAPEAAWEAHVEAMVADEEAQRLFRRVGMTPARYWLEMQAPTAPVPAVPAPPDLRIEPYSAAYERGVYAAHMESFADHWGYQRRNLETWLALTVRSTSFLPGLSRLAFAGAEIAGYVLSYDDPDPQRFLVGHVGVRRPWRRRGVAGALLARVLAAAAPAGRTVATLDVDAASPTGAVGVYERVGFTVAQRAVTYSAPVTADSPGAGGAARDDSTESSGRGAPMDRIAST